MIIKNFYIIRFIIRVRSIFENVSIIGFITTKYILYVCENIWIKVGGASGCPIGSLFYFVMFFIL